MQIEWNSFVNLFVLGMHVLALGVLFIPGVWYWPAILGCIIMYYLKAFVVVAGYHRYFAHKTYKTSRWFQFLLAFGSQMSMQISVITWQINHRHHHAHTDEHDDIHSPWDNPLTQDQNEKYKMKKGWMRLFYFLWSHIGSIITERMVNKKPDKISEHFLSFPEIAWLHRYQFVPYASYIVLCLFVSFFFGWQWFVWLVIINTVVLWNATWLINSVTHMFGYQTFKEGGKSKTGNIWWLWPIMLGENFHNNHHRYSMCTRQGFKWWEFDVTYYILKLLSYIRITWDIKEPTLRIMKEALEEKLTSLNLRLQKAVQEHKTRQKEKLERLIQSVQNRIEDLTEREMQLR